MNNEVLTAATSGMDGKWYSHRGYSVAGATTAIRSEPVVRTVRRTPFPSRKATQRPGRLQFLIMSEIKNQRLHAVPKSWTRYNLEGEDFLLGKRMCSRYWSPPCSKGRQWHQQRVVGCTDTEMHVRWATVQHFDSDGSIFV